MRKTTILGLKVTAALALGLLGALCSWPLAAQPAPPRPDTPPVPGLTVQGYGQVRTDPDEATVRLGVFTQETTARAAQDKANQVSAALLDAVAKLGVPRQDIQTSDLSLGPIYAPPRPEDDGREPRISGYQASYVVSVRLEKLDLVGRVIDAALAAGANQLQGVSFGLRDDRAAQTRALEQAVREAREKAQAIAGALGVRLGEVLEASEGTFSVVTPTFDKRAFAMEAAQAAPTPIAAGQVGVDAAVTVRFRISQ